MSGVGSAEKVQGLGVQGEGHPTPNLAAQEGG